MLKKNESNEKDIQRENTKNTKSNENEMIFFIVGILLLGAGLFMISKKVMVHSSWYGWRIGLIDLNSETVTIPLIIGIIWYFINPKSILAKSIIVLGILFIIITVIMSIRINLVSMSMFDYILIFGMTGAGAGLLLRNMFRKRK